MTTVKIIIILWDSTSCDLIQVYQRSEGVRWLNLQERRWRQHVSLKRRQISIRLRAAIFQKTAIFSHGRESLKSQRNDIGLRSFVPPNSAFVELNLPAQFSWLNEHTSYIFRVRLSVRGQILITSDMRLSQFVSGRPRFDPRHGRPSILRVSSGFPEYFQWKIGQCIKIPTTTSVLFL
jgi:hypothetical protein